MASRKGRKSWAGELPVETLNALKEESRESDLPMWKLVDQALRMYLGIDEGSTEAALERKLEELDGQMQEFEQQQEQLQQEREQLKEQKELIREQLTDVREQKASYEEMLDEILEDMLEHPERTVMANISDIRDAALEEYGRDTQDNMSSVMADLRERRTERDLDLPDHRFKRTGRTVESDAGAAADGGQSTPQLSFLSEPAENNEGDSE